MIVKCTFAMWLLNVCLITREISEEMIDCKLSLFHSRICKLFARICAFSTRATLLLKYCCLQIFEKKRETARSLKKRCLKVKVAAYRSENFKTV